VHAERCFRPGTRGRGTPDRRGGPFWNWKKKTRDEKKAREDKGPEESALSAHRRPSTGVRLSSAPDVRAGHRNWFCGVNQGG